MFETLEARRLLSATLTNTGSLQLLGTDGDDQIRVRQRGSTVLVRDNGVLSRFPAADVRGVFAIGLEGDDRIDCRGVRVRCELFGFEGNDVLYGGRGNDTIVGREGNDALYGLGGSDDLTDAQGDDLLVGGGNDTLLDYTGTNQFRGGGGTDLARYVDGTTHLHGAETTELLPPPTPVQPYPFMVTVSVRPGDAGNSLADVTVLLPISGHELTVGSPVRAGNQFTLAISIERLGTGGIDAFSYELRTFDLGALAGGNYEFVVTASTGVVTTVAFPIPSPRT